jgi:Zn-dependent protease
MTEIVFIFQLVALIFSVIIHEISHGYMAEYLGDPTARLAGRLTLNPIRHLDLFGSIILPLLLIFSGQPVIGWAKPVPYNPYNLKNPQKGGGLIALAGPVSNLLLALLLGLCIRVLANFPMFGAAQTDLIIFMFWLVVSLNISLALFNLLPIPPIDGSKVLALILPRRAQLHVDAFWARVWRIVQEHFVIALIVLFITLPKILDFIFYFLRPAIQGLTILFTGVSF